MTLYEILLLLKNPKVIVFFGSCETLVIRPNSIELVDDFKLYNKVVIDFLYVSNAHIKYYLFLFDQVIPGGYVAFDYWADEIIEIALKHFSQNSDWSLIDLRIPVLFRRKIVSHRMES